MGSGRHCRGKRLQRKAVRGERGHGGEAGRKDGGVGREGELVGVRAMRGKGGPGLGIMWA